MHIAHKLGNKPFKLGFGPFHIRQLGLHKFVSLGNLGIFVDSLKVDVSERFYPALYFPQLSVGGGNVVDLYIQLFGRRNGQLVFVKEL